jgi:hypothetical protein
MGEMRSVYGILVSLKGRDHLGGRDKGGRVILNKMGLRESM